MSQPYRLPSGGRLDRSRPLRFTFDGRALEGFAGDTLASALLANGVHLVGRSFKYHRPRGILSAGSEEPNALVEVDRGGGRRTPNLRATQVELYDGLVARSQNRWPSLAVDAGAVNDLVSPLLPPGFYYKTFMGPRWTGGSRLWSRVFEPSIRRAAGLGRAPAGPDPDGYAGLYAHCDVLVVGAGPAGLAAALAAAKAGARVILCDEGTEPGGSLLAEPAAAIDGEAAPAWVEGTVRLLASHPEVVLLPRTQAFGYFAHNFVALCERVTDHLGDIPAGIPRERLWQVRAHEVVLATGAIERPLVFAGNDRPGIMLADAGRAYLLRWGVRPGRRAVLATAHDGAYEAVAALHDAGVPVEAVADLRPEPGRDALALARERGVRTETGAVILGTRGRRRVREVTVRTNSGQEARFEADLLLMSGGWTPSVHLFSQSRGKVRYDARIGAFLPGLSAQAERSAGACAGTFALRDCLADGFAAGEQAARAAGRTPGTSRRFAVAPTRPLDTGAAEPPHAAPASSGKAFVDFQNDVTAKDLRVAVREGFRSVEHVKRYTTVGMATDQGKTSNVNALRIVADAVRRPVPEMGLTTFRMPYTPVTFGTFAGLSRGDLFDPVRTPPSHAWAEARGAVFEDVGLWKRARYFPQGGEDMAAATCRECRIVRSAVGMLDASTLGKIEVVGPDAAEFLNRMYVNAWTKLQPGRCRYGVLLNEPGFVIDDGVVGRLAPDRFHVTTTTGGAARVLALMEDYLQTEWPSLDVWLTSTTEQWGVIAVQGPKARAVVAELIEGLDLSPETLPHMAVGEARIGGVPVRVFRVSFTGELGFEINVPADYAGSAWDAVWAAVARHGGCAYGTEAMHILRAEKGYVIVGQDTDGTQTPDDVGLAWAIGRTKPDFVGKRSLDRPDARRPGRRQLVGLLTADPEHILDEGSQITVAPGARPGTPAAGHVTSAYWSEALGRSIALALVADGRRRHGDTVFMPVPGGDVPARVVPPVFLDPEGTRLHA